MKTWSTFFFQVGLLFALIGSFIAAGYGLSGVTSISSLSVSVSLLGLGMILMLSGIFLYVKN